MKLQIVPASLCHVTRLCAEMRQADRDELACFHVAPKDALVDSILRSDEDMRWTATLDGWPVAVFGVVNCDNGRGGAWLLTGDRLVLAKREAWLHSVRFVRTMHSRYPVLFNAVDARNVVSRRWLERLGFRSIEVVDVGPHPHHIYESRR